MAVFRDQRALRSGVRRQLALATALAALLVPATLRAQPPSKIPPGFDGQWVSFGQKPGPPPLGAPPTELPYDEIYEEKIADFVTPWARALHDALEWNTDDTGQTCRLDGPFRKGHGTGSGNFRLVEAPGGKLYQVWTSTDSRGLVRIFMDSPHPRNMPPTFNGDARGHFEGDDTFIVDVRGLNTRAWLGADRWAHSEELHIVERYRLYGGGQFIQLRVFVDDRLALKEPYTYTRYYRKTAEPTEGEEFVCNQATPEDNLWVERRNKLLDAHDAKFRDYVAKYANETLPGGSSPARAGDRVPASPSPDPAKLRTLDGIYEPIASGTALPGGLASRGTPDDIALKPEAQQEARARNPDFDPAKHCMVVGPFRMMTRDDNRFEVLTTPTRVTLLFERIALGNKREIYLGRKEHATRRGLTYNGDSIGRFEGDTLVVDTTGFNDATWLNGAGAPHSDALHLVERIRPIAGGAYLEYQVTADDPKALAAPYSYTRYYRRSTNELQEDFCENRKER